MKLVLVALLCAVTLAAGIAVEQPCRGCTVPQPPVTFEADLGNGKNLDGPSVVAEAEQVDCLVPAWKIRPECRRKFAESSRSSFSSSSFSSQFPLGSSEHRSSFQSSNSGFSAPIIVNSFSKSESSKFESSRRESTESAFKALLSRGSSSQSGTDGPVVAEAEAVDCLIPKWRQKPQCRSESARRSESSRIESSRSESSRRSESSSLFSRLFGESSRRSESGRSESPRRSESSSLFSRLFGESSRKSESPRSESSLFSRLFGESSRRSESGRSESARRSESSSLFSRLFGESSRRSESGRSESSRDYNSWLTGLEQRVASLEKAVFGGSESSRHSESSRRSESSLFSRLFGESSRKSESPRSESSLFSRLFGESSRKSESARRSESAEFSSPPTVTKNIFSSGSTFSTNWVSGSSEHPKIVSKLGETTESSKKKNSTESTESSESAKLLSMFRL